jgi:hypothetical protein
MAQLKPIGLRDRQEKIRRLSARVALREHFLAWLVIGLGFSSNTGILERV